MSDGHARDGRRVLGVRFGTVPERVRADVVCSMSRGVVLGKLRCSKLHGLCAGALCQRLRAVGVLGVSGGRVLRRGGQQALQRVRRR